MRDTPWFDHLRKFVDNGASAFKLDGAFQVNDHPDRLWGGKYFDDEVHNVYPTIYVKQMQEGFADQTDGRRACIYTACFYAGKPEICGIMGRRYRRRIRYGSCNAELRSERSHQCFVRYGGNTQGGNTLRLPFSVDPAARMAKLAAAVVPARGA